MGEQLNDFVIAGLGVGTVFAALICIIGICTVMGSIFSKLNGDQSNTPKTKKHVETDTLDQIASSTTAVPGDPSDSRSAYAYQAPGVTYVPANIENRAQVIAAISAAIAEHTGADISRIRILSVRERADSIPDRAKLCAAISAVIAEETGAAGVRIHSIRRTMPDRAKLCAAISAVIAEETGAEKVRIHSIRQI